MNVTVTVEGHRVLNRAPSLLQDRFRRELAKLHEWEQTMTLATLQRIAEMMEAESLEASPVLVAGPVDATPHTTKAAASQSSKSPAALSAFEQEQTLASQDSRKVSR